MKAPRTTLQARHILPPQYQGWLHPEILAMDVQENMATCNRCANSPTYDPFLKCCTYQPFLPNYLIGWLLLDEQTPLPEKETVREYIRTQSFALPIGLVPSPQFQLQLNHRKSHEFGNRADWLCPFYHIQSESCGIWQYRGSICTGYFCKSDFGKKGLHFWETFTHYLSLVEMTMAEEAMVEMGFSPRQVIENLDYLNRKKISPAEKNRDVLTAGEVSKLWEEPSPDIEGFYRKTGEWALQKNFYDVSNALGDLGLEWEQKTLAAHATSRR